jgi:hypothetical protein
VVTDVNIRYSKLKLIKVTRSEHQEKPPELKQIEGKEAPVWSKNQSQLFFSAFNLDFM